MEKYLFLGVPHDQNEQNGLTTSKMSGASVSRYHKSKQAYYINTPPTIVGLPNLQELENLPNLHLTCVPLGNLQQIGYSIGSSRLRI